MSRSVAEVRKNLEESQHRTLVWESVVNFLASCVDTEAREAQNKLRSSKEAPAVPQDLIAEIIQEIEAEKVSPLKKEIEILESLPVVETKNAQVQRPEARPKANAKRVRVVARPG